MYEEINRLDELRSRGSLTDDEFAQAKRRILSDHPDADQSGLIYGIRDETWCVLMHLSQLITWSVVGVLAPIAMWAFSKDQSDLARRHGARALNWLISSIIYMAIGGILTPALIGIPILLTVAVLHVIFPIMAAIKCHNGELWSYPLAIRFLDED